MLQVTPSPEIGIPVIPRRATFLQRSASVVSLVAWKARFEAYSGKFMKSPSFVSYAQNEEDVLDTESKLAKEQIFITEGYNTGPENDLPPDYAEVTAETPPPPHPEEGNENRFFKQDFTALENYFKKKLSFKKRKGSCERENEEDRQKVFDWLHGLPEGDNLEEFLEAYGIPTEGVNLNDLKASLRVFLKDRMDFEREQEIVSEEENDEIAPQRPAAWEQQMSDLRELADGDNLEKWLEGLDVPYFRSVPETKEEIRKYFKLNLDDTLQKGPPEPPPKVVLPSDQPPIKDLSALAPQWKELIGKMRNLKNEDELDKWLDSLEVPCNVPKDKLKVELKKFFMHEEFENFAGKSIIFQENSFAKKMWDKFEDASVLKQVALVAGTTAALGLIAVLSTTMLSFAFPAAMPLVVAPYFTEVFAQYFLQRQEIAFNLFNCHAQNAKPLSTAWAKQYVLWKYC